MRSGLASEARGGSARRILVASPWTRTDRESPDRSGGFACSRSASRSTSPRRCCAIAPPRRSASRARRSARCAWRGARSTDATAPRRASWCTWIVSVDPSARGRGLERALATGRARELPPPARFELASFERGWRERVVVVVGAGPAGLFAAHVLALHGVRVELLDRGPDLRERGRAVARFVRSREVDPERNLLFGEGGAGTYSDGKLYTRTHHELEEPIVAALVACGAPEAIGWDARAHIGTDRLHRVLPRLRAQLEAAGVRFHFGTRLESLVTDGAAARRIRAVQTSAGELRADAVVLAPGHSARDTLRALAAQGVVARAKPFQLGVRVEHPQELVDRGRYGADPALAARLGPSYYALVDEGRERIARPCTASACVRAVRSWPSVSEPGLLCTNGMSNSRHSSPYANAGSS